MYDLVYHFLDFPEDLNSDLVTFLVSGFSVVFGIAVLYLMFWFLISLIRRR